MEYKGLFPQEVMTYESNIAYTLRFMIDTKVSPVRLQTMLTASLSV